MVKKRPTTLDTFLDVSGVGQAKQQKYGRVFLKVIRDGMEPNEALAQEMDDGPGRLWTDEEEETLRGEFSRGASVDDMAQSHRRHPQAAAGAGTDQIKRGLAERRAGYDGGGGKLEYRYDDRTLDAGTFLALVQQVWPGEYDAEKTRAALARTINITAWDGGRLAGCLRILTDGCYFGTITELLVLPACRGRGPGADGPGPRSRAHAAVLRGQARRGGLLRKDRL